jgi:hypothetical protein
MAGHAGGTPHIGGPVGGPTRPRNLLDERGTPGWTFVWSRLPRPSK